VSLMLGEERQEWECSCFRNFWWWWCVRFTEVTCEGQKLENCPLNLATYYSSLTPRPWNQKLPDILLIFSWLLRMTSRSLVYPVMHSGAFSPAVLPAACLLPASPPAKREERNEQEATSKSAARNA
jgi:hypothetical protein